MAQVPKDSHLVRYRLLRRDFLGVGRSICCESRETYPGQRGPWMFRVKGLLFNERGGRLMVDESELRCPESFKYNV